jgi:DNA-binding NarL/FixJ family response regulator
MPTHVVVAESHPVIRTGIVTMLRDDPTLVVVAQPTDGPQTLAMCRRIHPEILVVALRLPGLSGLALTRALAPAPHAPRVLILSSHADAATVRAALAAGAAGYLLTTVSGPDLRSAVHGVRTGRQVLLGLEGILQERADPLGAQEVLILQEIAHGGTMARSRASSASAHARSAPI